MGKTSAVFAVTNIGGIALYAFLVFQILQTVQYEQRTNADFGDGLAFLTTAFPVLVLFVAGNLIWVAVMANQHRKHKDSGVALLIGLLAIAAWVATYFGLRYIP
jgi:hypothetical protein